MGFFKMITLGVLALASFATSQSIPTASYCSPANAMCAAINIPDSGDDTFFQLKAPFKSGWAAFGIGDQMAGSLIFVLYLNEKGDNVTISPRIATGHVMPQFEESIEITVLDGTGVKKEEQMMTANFKCSNCRTWSRGSLNTKGTDGFIWAIGGEDGIIKSDSKSATFQQHANRGAFTMDVAAARGGDGTQNPFLNKPSTTTSQGSVTTTPKSTADKLILGHGIIMAVTFLVLFPLGASAIRILASIFQHNALAIHRALQLFNLVLVLIAMGLGIKACELNQTAFTHFHHYFGIVIILLLFLQGGLGQFHHIQYKKTGRRVLSTHIHIWLGRIAIAAGIVNGGIGLGPKLADANTGEKAGYAIVAVIVSVAFVVGRWWKRGSASGEGVGKGSEGVNLERMRMGERLSAGWN